MRSCGDSSERDALKLARKTFRTLASLCGPLAPLPARHYPFAAAERRKFFGTESAALEKTARRECVRAGNDDEVEQSEDNK